MDSALAPKYLLRGWRSSSASPRTRRSETCLVWRSSSWDTQEPCTPPHSERCAILQSGTLHHRSSVPELRTSLHASYLVGPEDPGTSVKSPCHPGWFRKLPPAPTQPQQVQNTAAP